MALVLVATGVIGRAATEKTPVLLDDFGSETGLGTMDFDAAVARRIAVPADAGELRIPFRVGENPAGLTLTLVWEGGKKTETEFKTGAAPFLQADKRPGAGAESTVTKSLPYACLEVSAPRTRYFVRPNPDFYSEGEQALLRNKWNTFQDASEHVFLLSLQVVPSGVDLSLDGNYVGRLAGSGRLKEVLFPLPIETKVDCMPVRPWTPWSSLDLRSLNRPGAMTNAVLTVLPEALKARGVPLDVPENGANADVGCVRDVSPPNTIDTSGFARYHERSAFEGMPEALLMSVPVAPCTRAWVLCAAGDDPAKETAFNVRLTRYRKGGTGNAIVTTRVDLPLKPEACGSNLWCVGSVSYGGKDAKKTVPLWLAEVSLNSSEIQDVLYSDWAEGRLDFELLGLSRNSRSGVHVFAVTLERSPVEMEVKQVIQGSVFHNEEQPAMNVALRPLSSGAVVLRWDVEDVWGKKVTTGERQYGFADKDAPQELPVPLRMAESGWYRVVFSLHDEKGRPLLAHTAAFAQLPPDTRKAGYESPFGCWWQQYCHSHMTNPAVIGPLLFKAGIRRTTATCGSEELMKPWKVTLDMIPWLSSYHPPGTPALTTEEWFKEYEAKVREYRDRFPNSKLVMIFHESYDSGMGPEAWDGEPDPLTAFGLIEKAKLSSTLLRGKFPDLKIIAGNDGWSGALISQLLRGGVPPDRFDALGMERLIGYFAKDTMPPERHEASWTLRKMARQYGCEAPPTDCYESGGRGNYGMSQRRIAEYVVRDSLVGLAWGFPYIGVGVISENVNGYYHTRWGGDSILRRTPLLYPQPQYVAIATMTRVLDCAKLVRRVPTGSHTAYALEFARGEERVYALWTPRGTCDLLLKFPKDGAVMLEGLYGQPHPVAVVNGELRVTASEEVTYVTASGAAIAVTAGKRVFPQDQPPDGTVILSALADPAAWTLTGSKGVECGPYPYRWLPWRTTGKGKLDTAADPEKGACLSLELIPQGEVTELLAECLTLQATTPVPVPGKPSTLGVWVKGNSSWGRVMFEILDAEGERFLGGSYTHEPWGTTYIDFDGWCFVTLPLSDKSPARSRFYYSSSALWTGNGGNGTIDYPIRIAGLTVEMKRKALDLAEMAPVAPAILLKDLSAYGAPEDMGPDNTLNPGLARNGTVGQSAPGTGMPPGEGSAAAAALLFRDCDLGYCKVGARPAGFAQGCSIKEEDSRRFVSCEKGVKGLFANLRYYGAQNWLDYEWSFRFRFPVKDKVGLSCTLRTGVEPSPFNLMKLPALGPADKCKGISIEYSAQGFKPGVIGGIFEMAKGATWAEKGLPPLEAGRWYRTVIRAAGRALDISMEHEGRLVRVYRGPIPAGGGGLNLTSTNPIDLVDIQIREVVATDEDWSHAGRIRVEEGSPVPGTQAFRIDGPHMVSDAIRLGPGSPCILSAYVRAEKDGLPVTMIAGSKTKVVRATRDWTRQSFLALSPPASLDGDACLFALKGSVEGPVWVAAPQVERAPFSPLAKRAAQWDRTLEKDYEIDEKNPHRGLRSIRSMPDGGLMAVQERELATEESRPLLFGGWYRTEGVVTNARFLLELYRDRKYWTPMTPTEEEPRETFVVDIPSESRAWADAQTRIPTPKPFKRYRLSVIAGRSAGTLRVDDLVVRPLGSFGPSPDINNLLNGDFGEEGGLAGDISLLGAMDEDVGTTNGLLMNAGFEEPMTNGVVTSACDQPSAYGPTMTSNTWMKVE
jgi:hypothetical protein